MSANWWPRSWPVGRIGRAPQIDRIVYCTARIDQATNPSGYIDQDVYLKPSPPIVGIGGNNRKACGIAVGDLVSVDLEPDTQPRVVDISDELAAAFNRDPQARQAFQRLPYGKQRAIVVKIERARTAGTRQKRVAEAIAALHQQ